MRDDDSGDLNLSDLVRAYLQASPILNNAELMKYGIKTVVREISVVPGKD
jgi:hypothetical protein